RSCSVFSPPGRAPRALRPDHRAFQLALELVDAFGRGAVPGVKIASVVVDVGGHEPAEPARVDPHLRQSTEPDAEPGGLGVLPDERVLEEGRRYGEPERREEHRDDPRAV